MREWNGDLGWGVVDGPDLPGGCWVHFSHIKMSGYCELSVGQRVRVTWESVDQDGFAYRAVTLEPAPPMDPVP